MKIEKRARVPRENFHLDRFRRLLQRSENHHYKCPVHSKYEWIHFVTNSRWLPHRLLLRMTKQMAAAAAAVAAAMGVAAAVAAAAAAAAAMVVAMVESA